MVADPISISISLVFAIIAVFFGWFADQYGVINTLFLGQGFMIFAVYLNYKLFKHNKAGKGL